MAVFCFLPYQTTNPAGQVTTSTVDPATGHPLTVTDPNGSLQQYTYDTFQRLKDYYSPTEKNGGGADAMYSYIAPANQPVEVRLEFKATHGDTKANFSVESEFTQRWGVFAENDRIVLQYNDGSGWQSEDMRGLQVGMWYKVRLRLDNQAQFLAEVCERDNPTNCVSKSKPMPKWLSWRFHQWVYREKVHMSNYVEDHGSGDLFQDPFTSLTGNWVYNSYQSIVTVDGEQVLESQGTGGGWSGHFYRAARTVKTFLPFKVQVGKRRDSGGSTTGVYLTTRSFYDGLGRLVQEYTDRTGGHSVKNVHYDAQGRLMWESIPWGINGNTHFMGSAWGDVAKPKNRYTYDALGRPRYAYQADGTTKETRYEDRARLVIDEKSHAKRYEQDPYGRLTAVKEYTGGNPWTLYATTTYEYDVADRLKKVVDAAGTQTTMTYDKAGRKTAMSDPDMGSWTYTYHPGGALATQKDAKNQTIEFTYDDLDRLTVKKLLPSTVLATYGYDQNHGDGGSAAVGRRSSMTDGSGSTKWYYDVKGRVKKEEKTIEGTYVTLYEYNALDQISKLTYPDGEVVATQYDAGGLPMKLSGADVYVQAAVYNAQGQIKRLDLSGSSHAMVTNFGYFGYHAAGLGDSHDHTGTTLSRLGRLWKIQTSKTAGGTLQNLQYGYDNVGNVTWVADYTPGSPGGNMNYAYDDLDRLTQAYPGSGSANAYDESYTYNAIGNILTHVRGGVTKTYSYDATKKHAVTAIALSTGGNHTYTYDANGNQTAGMGRVITWNAENRPIQVSKDGATTTFVYDGDGKRVKKVSPVNTFAEGFQSTNGHWAYISNTIAPWVVDGQYTIKTTGTEVDWRGAFYRNSHTVLHGMQAKLEFKVDASSEQSLFFLDYDQNGVYYRWGVVANAGKILVQYKSAGQWVYPKDLITNLAPNRWYVAVFTVDDANGFGVLVYERDNPSVSGSYSQTMPSGLSWRFGHQIWKGSDYIANYVERQKVGQTTVYVGNHYEKNLTTGEITKYYHLGGRPVGLRKVLGAAQSVRYLLSDHLGGAWATVDHLGNGARYSLYYAYGQSRLSTGGLPTDRLYTGQTFDDAVGLYHYGARSYDPYLGRFVSPDPFSQSWVGQAGTVVPLTVSFNYVSSLSTLSSWHAQAGPHRPPLDPQLLNRYAYSRNNPITYYDPTGKWVWVAVGAVAGGLVGAGAYAVTHWDQVQQGNVNWGEAGAYVAGGALAGSGVGLLAEAVGVAAAATAASASAPVAQQVAHRASVWAMPAFERGRAIEQSLGANLARNFPVIDRFREGVVTSIKSIDLGAATYQNIGNLTSTVRGYINALQSFEGAKWGDTVITRAMISGKQLELVIPTSGWTAQQMAALQQLQRYAMDADIVLRIVQMH